MKKEEKEEILYHYTDLSAFKSIIENKSIWMTNVKFLNDTSEFSEGLSLFQDVLRDQLNIQSKEYKAILSKREKQAFINIFNTFEKSFASNSIAIYVTSFSEKDDLLSQWRSYGKGKNGISLHLNKKHLQSHIVDEFPNSIELKKCIYSKKIFIEKSKDLINIILDFLNENEKKDNKEDVIEDSKLEKLFSKTYTLIASFKDSSFEEEQEWRLIKVTDTLHKRSFRIGSSCLIPYFEHNLGEIHDFHQGITISPNQKEDYLHSKQSIELFLYDEKYKGTGPFEDLPSEENKNPYNVEKSKIPYREW